MRLLTLFLLLFAVSLGAQEDSSYVLTYSPDQIGSDTFYITDLFLTSQGHYTTSEYEFNVKDYNQPEPYETPPAINFTIGVLGGGNFVHYLSDTTKLSGTGLTSAVSAEIHSTSETGLYGMINIGYNTTSVRSIEELNVRRSSMFTSIGVGITDGEYVAGGVLVGYHKSDHMQMDSPTMRFFGTFKYPIDNNKRYWIRLYGDVGGILIDQFTKTDRSPLAGSFMIGISRSL